MEVSGKLHAAEALSRYSLDSILGGPQGPSGYCGEEKKYLAPAGNGPSCRLALASHYTDWATLDCLLQKYWPTCRVAVPRSRSTVPRIRLWIERLVIFDFGKPLAMQKCCSPIGYSQRSRQVALSFDNTWLPMNVVRTTSAVAVVDDKHALREDATEPTITSSRLAVS
jgi:hypothetical protein